MVWVWRGEPGTTCEHRVGTGTSPGWAANKTHHGSHLVATPKVPVISLGATDGSRTLPPVTVRSMSPAPATFQAPLVVVPSQRQHSPSPKRIPAQPVPVATVPIIQVAVPVENVPTKATVQLVPAPPSAGKAAVEKDLLLRIDGVVSEMERELSEDLAMCMNSPLRELRCSSSGAHVARGAGEHNESTIDWIDRQIWAIEHRREACEMRQAHLADLRRIVAEGQAWGLQEKGGGSEGSMGGSSTVLGGSDEEPAAAPRPTRLAALEAEHEVLKKQVECERGELLRVRAALEGECESRLAEVRSLAEAVEAGKRRAWAAEEAAEQRAQAAVLEAQALQEQLQLAEAACERERQASLEAASGRARAGEDLRQLEESSRAVLDDCRALQARVQELQLERAAFLDKQLTFEEERHELQARLRLLEEQRLEAEARRQALADENSSLACEHRGALLDRDQRSVQEEALLRRRESLLCEELLQRDAALAAAKSSCSQAEEAMDRQSGERMKELESELLHAQTHGESHVARQAIASLKQQVDDARLAEATAEERARSHVSAEVDRRHRASMAEAEKLRSDLAEWKAAVLDERRACKEAEQKHRKVEADVARMHADHQRLREGTEAEQKARREVERRHREAEVDALKLRNDQQQHQAELATEQRSREEAEQRHLQAVKDAEQWRADHERLVADKAAEVQARSEAERSHQKACEALERMRAEQQKLLADRKAERQAREQAEEKHMEAVQQQERLSADAQKLQQDLAAEQQAHEELEMRHQAVVEAQRSLHGDRKELQALMDSEKRARMEAERKHKAVENDKQQLHLDHQELHKAREDERRSYEEAERKHREVMDEAEQLRLGRQRLQQERAVEQRSREEAERKHQEVAADRERLLADQEKLRADLASEQRAREDMERRHQQALKDTERLRAEQRKLQADKLAEQRAREEADRKHRDASTDAAQLLSDHQRLQADMESEQSSRREVEQKHRELEAELRQLRATRQEQEAAMVAAQHAHREHASRIIWETEQRVREELGALHQEEKERLRNSHHEARDVDRQAYEELEKRYQLLVAEKQRMQHDLAELQEAIDGERLAREEAERSLRLVHCEKEDLTISLNNLRKAEGQHDAVERLLRQARSELDEERGRRSHVERQLSALQGQLDGEHERSTHLEQQAKAELADERGKLARLERLVAERDEVVERLHQDLEQARLDGEVYRRDAEDSMQKKDELRLKLEMTWKEKLEQAEREIEALKSGERSQRSERPSLQRLERASLSQPSERRSLSQGLEVLRRPSLWAEPVASPVSLGAHAPTGSLGQRLQEAQQRLAGAMAAADAAHIRLLGAQLGAAVSGRASDTELPQSLSDFEGQQEIAAERRAAASVLEAVMHDFRALLEAVPTQHGMPQQQQQEISEHLQAEVQRCKEELELLGLASALGDLPEALVEALVDLSESGSPPAKGWQSGFSPLHWCAQHGRRDILMFIHRQLGGASMVDVRDQHGRTPLFYAERAQRANIAHYLRKEAGAAALPREPQERRPSTSGLPQLYAKVLHQVETQGWHTVKWKDGYTMLHWAAEKGHSDLCKYLIKLGADPHGQDSQSRTPTDCAQRSGHPEIAKAIQEAADRPRESLLLSAAFRSTVRAST